MKFSIVFSFTTIIHLYNERNFKADDMLNMLVGNKGYSIRNTLIRL